MPKKNTIILVFDVDNNFDPVDKKYGNTGDIDRIASQADWLLRCAKAAIEDCYGKGAPRREQMTQLTANLTEQLKKQLTKKQIEELKLD